jgi:hypothetical protein
LGAEFMQNYLIKVLAVGLLSGLAWTTSAYGTPGERFHIKEDNTGIHVDPSATASVVRRLNKGDRVIEFRRQGSWVKVSQLGAVGEGGWVEISRLAPDHRYWADYLLQMRQQREMEKQQREMEKQQREWAEQQRELAEQQRERERRQRWEQKLYEVPQFGLPGLGGC